MGVQFKMDTREFTETLRRYRQLSSKDPAAICNQKALRVMVKSVKLTPKSTREQIKQDLLVIGDKGAPLAALLVNKARKAAGLPGLFGKAMKDAVMALIKSRKVATLRAGYAQGIRDLARVVNGNVPASISNQGHGKGYGKPAKEGGFKATTEFANLIGAKWDTRDGATPKASPALEQAFADEARDMDIYIERKLKESADRAGIKHG